MVSEGVFIPAIGFTAALVLVMPRQMLTLWLQIPEMDLQVPTTMMEEKALQKVHLT